MEPKDSIDAHRESMTVIVKKEDFDGCSPGIIAPMPEMISVVIPGPPPTHRVLHFILMISLRLVPH